MSRAAFYVLFTVSGFAGLIYESIWTHYLKLFLGHAAYAQTLVLAIFMALQQLGIATDIVTTAFAILFGAIALALALSFGLGTRELAGEITREWYEKYRRERDDAIARELEAEREEDLEFDDEFGDDDDADDDLPPSGPLPPPTSTGPTGL